MFSSSHSCSLWSSIGFVNVSNYGAIQRILKLEGTLLKQNEINVEYREKNVEYTKSVVVKDIPEDMTGEGLVALFVEEFKVVEAEEIISFFKPEGKK